MLNSLVYQVFIESLELTGYHGVMPEERVVGNRFLIDVEMVVAGQADSTDEIEDTVDYGAACLLLKKVSESRSFLTVEALAGAMADALISNFELVREAQVRVAKLLPPVPLAVEAAGAVVTRKRKA